MEPLDCSIYRPHQRDTNVKITVHEHRASTADDVRLLAELENKAWNKVTDLMLHKAQNNLVEFVSFKHEATAYDLAHRAKALFSINGHKFEVEAEIDEGRFLLNRNLIEAVAEKLAKTIAIQLIQRW